MANGDSLMIKVRNFDLLHTTTNEAPDKHLTANQDNEAIILRAAQPALTKKMIQSALAGNVLMLKLCVGRLETLERGPLGFSLPAMMSIDDLPVATAAILDAAMKGVIPAHIGADLAKLVTIHASALRDVELHQRLKALEGGD